MGFFTSAVVEGLKGKAADSEGTITIANLVKYVQARVPEMVLKENPGVDQKPHAETYGYRANDLVLAYSPGLSIRPDKNEHASSAKMINEIVRKYFGTLVRIGTTMTVLIVRKG